MKEIYSQEEILLGQINFEKNKAAEIEQKADRKKFPNLKVISAAYDNYYLYNKLKLYCKFLSYSGIANEKQFNQRKEDFAFIEVVLNHLDQETSENPGINIYNKIRQLYELPQDTNEETIFEFANSIRDSIQEKITTLCDLDISEVYTFITNFCIVQLNRKRESFAELIILCNNDQLNLLYIRSAQEKIHLNPAILKNTVETAFRITRNNFFKNIKTNGLQAKDKATGFEDVNEWVEKLITHYGDYLAEEFSNYKVYCLAFLKFQQSAYLETYKILKKLGKPKGTFINVAIRTLFLRAIYEVHLTKPNLLIDDKVDVNSITRNLDGLVSEGKKWKTPLSQDHIKMYKNFIRYYRSLFKIYNLGDQFRGKESKKYLRDLEKLKDALTINGSASKSWLLSKVEQM